MQERRHARADLFSRLEPITAFEHVRGALLITRATILPRNQCQCGRAFGPLLPERLNLLVDFFEFRGRRAPVTEDGRDLRWCALLARNFENLSDTSGNRICHRVGRTCHADAEPPE